MIFLRQRLRIENESWDFDIWSEFWNRQQAVVSWSWHAPGQCRVHTQRSCACVMFRDSNIERKRSARLLCATLEKYLCRSVRLVLPLIMYYWICSNISMHIYFVMAWPVCFENMLPNFCFKFTRDLILIFFFRSMLSLGLRKFFINQIIHGIIKNFWIYNIAGFCGSKAVPICGLRKGPLGCF